MLSPSDLEAARQKGQLRCQLDALETISAHVERYGHFQSSGYVSLGRSRILPVLREIARNGWHVIWAHKWGSDIPQPDGEMVYFVVGQTPDIGFWESFLPEAHTRGAFRIAPGPDGTFVESPPISPIPRDPHRKP